MEVLTLSFTFFRLDLLSKIQLLLAYYRSYSNASKKKPSRNSSVTELFLQGTRNGDE